MTRMDSARAATGTAKDTVKHAAEAVAPYAATARNQYQQLAHEARERLGPRLGEWAHEAHEVYDVYVVPRVKQARAAVPAEWDRAALRAGRRARAAADYAAPRAAAAAAATKHAAESTKETAVPIGREAASRSTAALLALRGEVSRDEIRKLTRRRHRYQVAGTAARNVVVVGAIGAGAVAAWRWWDRQLNPDWLVEPPAPTEVRDDESSTRLVDDSEYRDRESRGESVLDPEVEAKQSELDADAVSEAGNPTDTGRAYYERGEET